MTAPVWRLVLLLSSVLSRLRSTDACCPGGVWRGRCCFHLQVVVVSAMGSHESSPIKVTDLLLNMVAKAARQDEGFLLDLAALQVRRTIAYDASPYRPSAHLDMSVQCLCHASTKTC